MSTQMGNGRDHGHIELSVPGRADVLQLVRMVATFVATQADLAFEDVADLRLATDELCASVLFGAATDGGTEPPALRIRYGWDRESVEVSCMLSVSGQPISPRSDHVAGVESEVDAGPSLSRQILGTLVDEHHIESHRGWLRKRRIGALC
jgi:hypothetical protein